MIVAVMLNVIFKYFKRRKTKKIVLYNKLCNFVQIERCMMQEYLWKKYPMGLEKMLYNSLILSSYLKFIEAIVTSLGSKDSVL